MPYINKIQRKPKAEKPLPKETENKELRKKLYNTTQWRKLRDVVMKSNPLCAECLKKGKVVAAEDIHHIKSPFNYREGTINWTLAYDEQNLEPLCKQCHQEIHNRTKPSAEEVLKQIEELMMSIPD